MHLECEQQVLSFTEIIPYRYNYKIADQIYSPRLYNTLQGICSCIDDSFKVLADILSITLDGKNMPTYIQIFDAKRMLSYQRVLPSQLVILEGRRLELYPFKFDRSNGENVPPWWTAYNDTKHRISNDGAFKATLGNVMNALGGLVILLHLLDRALTIQDSSFFLDSANWLDSNSDSFEKDYEQLRFNEAGRSHLFFTIDKPYLDSMERKFKSKLFYYPMYPKWQAFREKTQGV